MVESIVTPFIELKDFKWIDIQGPTLEQLQQLADEYNLHSTSIQDCMDSEHLPKYELFDDVTFMILRVYDESSTEDADTIQELSKKIAIFIGENFILTIHRKEITFLNKLLVKWQKPNHCEPGTQHQKILSDLFLESIGTFKYPINQFINRKDDFESKIFSHHKHKKLLQEGYYIKRKASACKKILKLELDVLVKITAKSQIVSPILQDLKETLEKLTYYCEDIVENITILLGLYISMESQKTNEASHKTNEIMRVLTVFSVFFMPLNFIAGVYGMNFANMPELHFKNGYFLVLSLMLITTLVIFIWIWKKGWLKNDDLHMKNKKG